MRKLQILARASLLSLTFVLHSLAGDGLIVRVDPSVINAVSKQHGLKVEKQLKQGQGLYLVSLPKTAASSTVIQALKANPLVQNVERNADVVLPELSSNFQKSGHKVPRVQGGAPSITMPGNPWVAYLNQPANSILRIADAQKLFGYGNSGLTVAVIDTAIDTSHPVLAPVMVAGHNSLDGSSNVSLAQETTPWIDQETTPWIDGSGTVVLNQETTPWIDQETTPWIDQETTPWIDTKTPPAYGHGTMVAGIVHLVAPNVRIMPLQAFNGQGSGTLADVIEAINWAVEHHANVINMSFSAGESSPELQAAINAAAAANVICIAAVANDGLPQIVYPAGIGPVIGVAATTNDDYRASFSNFGDDVRIAAPGEQVISTYPQNRYAAGWGTSFSTPYVAGTVALMRSINSTEGAQEATKDLSDGSARVKSPELPGRLDVFNSGKKARN